MITQYKFYSLNHLNKINTYFNKIHTLIKYAPCVYINIIYHFSLKVNNNKKKSHLKWDYWNKIVILSRLKWDKREVITIDIDYYKYRVYELEKQVIELQKQVKKLEQIIEQYENQNDQF